MRVDLAAQVSAELCIHPHSMCYAHYIHLYMQVLSETISKALQLTGGPEATETVRFISMFDKFFDCVNVANFTSGRFKRKVFQQPYRSGEDFRLNVLFTCIIMCLAH